MSDSVSREKKKTNRNDHVNSSDSKNSSRSNKSVHADDDESGSGKESPLDEGPLQGKLIAELMTEHGKMKVGDAWFLVSMAWWTQWTVYAEYGDGIEEKQRDSPAKLRGSGVMSDISPAPGKIRNSSLCEQGTVELAKDLQLGSDFILVPEVVWKQLHSWYGGGPSFERIVIADGERNGEPYLRVEVYPLHLRMILLRRQKSDPPLRPLVDKLTGPTEKVVVSSALSVKDFRQLVRLQFSLPPAVKFRLWNDMTVDTRALFQSDSKTLADECLLNGQKVIVELPIERSSRWPLEPPKKSRWPSFLSTGGGGGGGGDRSNSHQPRAGSKPRRRKRRGVFASIERFLMGADSDDSSDDEHHHRPSGGRRRGRDVGGGYNDDAEAEAESEEDLEYAERRGQGGPVVSPRNGTCGLYNLGNTCFMNSGLQCLAQTAPLTHYFLSGRYRTELNLKNPLGMKGRLAEQYAELVRHLWGGSSSAVKPHKLKALIARRAPTFSGYRQHDAQELLAFLLDGLHEDLNRVRDKEYVEVADFDGTNDAEAAEEAWENHLKRNRSAVVDLFHGQLRSELTCPRCSRISVTFDPFSFLSLPVPAVQTRTYNVVVVRQQEIYFPIKYSIPMDRNLRLENLRERLSELAGFPMKDSLVFAELNLHEKTVTRFQPVDNLLRDVRDGSNLYGYELPGTPGELEGQYYLQVIHRIPRNERTAYSNSKWMNVGYPLLVYVKPSMTCEGFHHLLWRRCQWVLHDDLKTRLPQTTKSSSGDSGEDKPASSGSSSSTTSTTAAATSSSASSATTATSSSSSSSSTNQEEVTRKSNKQEVHTSEKKRTPSSVDGQVQHQKEATKQSESVASPTNSRHDTPENTNESPAIGTRSTSTAHDEPKMESSASSKHKKEKTEQSPSDPANSGNGKKTTSHSTDHDTPKPTRGQKQSYLNQHHYPFEQIPLPETFPFRVSVKLTKKRGPRIHTELYDVDPTSTESLESIGFKDASTVYLSWSSEACEEWLDVQALGSIAMHPSVRQCREAKKKYLNLYDCLDHFQEKERLGPNDTWYCNKCEEHQQALKRMVLWKPPPVLVLHLKRFRFSGHYRSKINEPIQYPIKGLDLSSYMQDSSSSFDAIYDLFAVCVHMGGTGGGHYVAYGKHMLQDRWYLYDDSRVRPVEPNAVVVSDAYLLFYVRRDFEWSSVGLEPVT